MVSQVVESWLNGGERLYLWVSDGHWSVVHDASAERTITPCGDERQARTEVVRMRMTVPGWRRLG